jgi:c-di-GMP-binding flagellar brake protein YcgR
MQQQDAIIIIVLIFVLVSLTAFIFQFWQKYQNKKALAKLLDANTINTYGDIKTILVMAQEQRIPLVIKRNAKGKPFSSFPIKIDNDPKSSTILIDSLFPEEGNELISGSQFISVAFFLKNTESEYLNIPYVFNASYIRGETYRSYPALRISFPKTIKRNQRRNYNRVEPSIGEPISITLKLEDEEVIENMDNISGGGIGFYTNLDKSILWPGNKIKSASFTLPDGTEITTQLIVRWITKNVPEEIASKKGLHFYCGTEFIELDNTSRKKIIQYILKREREELRKLSKEYD